MNDASKTLLMNAVKEWSKFTAERDRMKAIAAEIAAVTQRVVLDTIAFMKTQNVDVLCDNVANMKVMGQPVVIEPVVDAVFPTVKAKVNLTCSGATRSIVINPNGSISAGGNPFMFDQLKKGIPDSFTTNAAEFISDAFLFVARNQTPEDKSAAPQSQAPPPAPPQGAPAPPAAVKPAVPPAIPPRPASPPQAPPQGMPPRPAQPGVPPVRKP